MLLLLLLLPPPPLLLLATTEALGESAHVLIGLMTRVCWMSDSDGKSSRSSCKLRFAGVCDLTDVLVVVDDAVSAE